ncbi:surface antigen-domain-containing protein [Scheffersomyces xylosifermentans]|uniref:surface antigen-domain-containing protein n=1 Tax=Scheffersomyces xylosifermentans TaxID=1304137 RepID=UPI00315D70C4
MSLDHDDMIDRLSSARIPDNTNISKEEKTLKSLQEEKENLMIEQNRQFMEELFVANKSQPIKVKNVQITNSQNFRDTFLEAQFKPLLASNQAISLESFLSNIEKVSKSFVKLNLVENLLVSIHPVPGTITQSSIFGRRTFPDNGASISVVPIFNIVPVKKFYAKTGTNIGNGEGDGYIQFQLKNLFGGGENLIFDAVTGTKTSSSYLLNYNQPVGNNADYITENTFSVNTRKWDWLQADVSTTGFSNKLYTQFDSYINHELTMENYWKVLENLSSKSMDVMVQSGSHFKSSLIYNMTYDSRNNKHLPTIGKFFRFGVEFNGLLKVTTSPYLKTIFESQYALSLPKNWYSSLIFSTKSGLLYSLNKTSSVLDRFYIGGPNDVRSFTLNGLGPKDYNSSIGGDIFFNGGISLVSKIPKVSPESNFKIHNFINFGKLIPLDKSAGVLNAFKAMTTDYSVSCGFGILYNHPMARFELNFVLPLAVHERDYARKGLQYGIGLSFL